MREVDDSLQVSTKLKAFDDQHGISGKAAAAWTSVSEKSKQAVDAAKPVVVTTAETVKAKAGAAVEAATPVMESVKAKAGATAESVKASAGETMKRVQEDERVQQGWAKASSAAAGVGAWASALAQRAQQTFSDVVTPPPPPPAGTTSTSAS